jgi:alkylhydroperoxidase family enzyme
MAPRMNNPSLVVPDALPPLLDLGKVINQVGVPMRTLDLVRMRVSQINGRISILPTDPEAAGLIDQRLHKVAAWRDADCFTDAERAALALAETAARLSDGVDPVPDDVWDEATRHYTEPELSALIMHIGLVTLWNCVNISTRQKPADWR